MDTVSQFALGAAVGVAAMGRRTAPWKAALWGGVCGTLPDLDVFIDHGDPVANMTLHRAETHALFWITLASLPIGAAIAWASGERDRWRRWWLAAWLALITHPLLDAMTVYGTQLLLPFTNQPFGVGSVFIIDPLYTLPLLVGTGVALARQRPGWNTGGLVLSTAYLAWGVFAQQQVEATARASLKAQGIDAQHVLVTPSAFNSVLWRVVAVTPDAYHEGFRSLLDAPPTMTFDRFDRGAPLAGTLRGTPAVDRIMWFSRGFWKLQQRGDAAVIADLRMGQEPNYVFMFEVARLARAPVAVTPTAVGGRGDIGALLSWQWRRLRGEIIPPPR